MVNFRLRKFGLIFCFLILFGGCSGPQIKKTGEALTVDSGEVELQDIVTSTAIIKPRINVYVENSGSMKGYVKGITDFESFIYDYLMKLDLDFDNSALNLNYINSKIEPQSLGLKEFIKNIEPQAFNGGSSDIASMIEMILNKTVDNDISIFISDCIFSPGKGKNADDYLNMQKTEIEYSMSKYLKRCFNGGVLMYQLTSLYDGYYFNCEDKPQAIKNSRPYYVLVFGKSEKISQLREVVPESKFSIKIDNVLMMSRGGIDVDYAIVRNSGDFETSREDSKHSIRNLKVNARNNKASFAINVDFSTLLVDEDYLLSKDNYELKFGKYEIESVKKCDLEGYTHTIKISSDFVSSGDMVIKLKRQEIPLWLSQKFTKECDISAATMSKTYGLQYLIDGMQNAFNRTGGNLTEFNIKISN